MKVEVVFHPNDDLSQENVERIRGFVLDMEEAKTLIHHSTKNRIIYDTELSAVEVIQAWEAEGYSIPEFLSFSFKS